MRLGILSIPNNFHCKKWASALAKAGADVFVYSLENGEIPNVTCRELGPKVNFKGNYTYPSYYTSYKNLAKHLKQDKK